MSLLHECPQELHKSATYSALVFKEPTIKTASTVQMSPINVKHLIAATHKDSFPSL